MAKRTFQSIDDLAKPLFADTTLFGITGDTDWNSLLNNYTTAVKSTLITNIGKADREGEDVTNVKQALPQKLEWILFNHQSLHYAPVLPLVTPKVIQYMAAIFDSFPHALLEVSSDISGLRFYGVNM